MSDLGVSEVFHARDRHHTDGIHTPQKIVVRCTGPEEHEFEGHRHCDAPGFTKKAGEHLREASEWFKRESEQLDRAFPYISWGSEWGVNEERSRALAPILAEAADCYEKAFYAWKARWSTLTPECGGR